MSKGTIYFRLADVAALAAELDAVDPLLGTTDSWLDAEEGRTTGPALMWVKDDGTYLMTNVKRAEGQRPTVVHGAASPDGPKLDGSQWDLTRSICGGDDFAEYLPLADFGPMILGAHADGLRWLVLEVMGDSFGVGVE